MGLSDGFGRALAAALRRLSSLRVLDLSHNYLGSDALRGLAHALHTNHSLAYAQLLPQWMAVQRDAELAINDALAERRVKLELTVRAGRGLLCARGDVGEPAVRFEWRGAVRSTGRAGFASQEDFLGLPTQ